MFSVIMSSELVQSVFFVVLYLQAFKHFSELIRPAAAGAIIVSYGTDDRNLVPTTKHMIPNQWHGFDHVWKGLGLFDSSDAQARKPEPSTCQNLSFSTVKLQVASVLWDCWLGIRKSIRSVKAWVTRCWRGYLSGAKCKWFPYGPADATATPSSLASLTSRMVEPFRCWLTGVVLEKSPLSCKLQVHSDCNKQRC